MANIYDYLNQIKNAIYGKDVRNAIYNAIYQVYIDATKNGNTDTEVVEARGSYTTLKDRLDNINTTASSSLTLQSVSDTVPIITLTDNKFVECINDIQGINFNVSTVDVNFNSIVSFSTDNINSYTAIALDNIKFIGDSCNSGQLVLNSNSLYFIEFRYLKANTLLAVVNAYLEGDNGNSGDIEDVIEDFTGADDIVNLAMTYFNARDKFITYGQTNILTSNGSKTWNEVTVVGADSTDGRYRNLDCSALIGLIMRGIGFNEVFLNQTTYNNKDLSARTSIYSWATEPPRTAAEILRFCEEKGWVVSQDKWHVGGDWQGLKKGDLYFLGGSNNGRYKGIYHVGLYIGNYTASDGTQKICILDCSSNSAIEKHSDGKIKAVRILSFSKVPTSEIVGIVRIQG